MYYFYMDGVLLPVAPEKFTWKIRNTNKTMTLINEVEINFLRNAGLTEFEFDALIPAVQYSFATYDDGFKRPSFFLDHFEKLKADKKPFQFIVTRQTPDGQPLFDNNICVSLEEYTIKEDVKSGFDLTVSIKLKQFKSFETKDVKEDNGNVTVTNQRQSNNSLTQDTTYTVKKGDCLWNIAKKYYGDGSKYTKIYEANKDKITNPNLIYVDQVLVIPAL